MISIIIPFYNSKNYIKEIVCMLNSQTCKDFEAIFVNDGSTDYSFDDYSKICERFTLINIPTNKGVSNARNIGIENSKGDFICFIDADDAIGEKYVETICSLINNIDFDVLLFNYFMQKKGNIIEEKYFENDSFVEDTNKIIKDVFRGKFFSSVWRMCVKKKIIQDVKFDCNLTYCEDLDFIINVFNKQVKVYSITDSLYVYKYNVNSVTKSYDCNMFDKQIKLHQKIEFQLKNNQDSELLDCYYGWHLGMYRFLLKNSGKKNYKDFKNDCDKLYDYFLNDNILSKKNSRDFIIMLLKRKKWKLIFLLCNIVNRMRRN